jgi:hypothetical protein
METRTYLKVKQIPAEFTEALGELRDGWGGLHGCKFWFENGVLFVKAPKQTPENNAFYDDLPTGGELIVHYQPGNAWLDSRNRWVF